MKKAKWLSLTGFGSNGKALFSSWQIRAECRMTSRVSLPFNSPRFFEVDTHKLI